ncbi:MAG: peptidase U32 family protein [Bacteroidota bacterium]|nr:peptidase U32 family protein [Bacteroidota bacterium]
MSDFQNIEIMSPVGSYESLMAAIQGEADSVYFGVEYINMRSRSSNNFTLDDLKKISSICKKNNIKSYITVNTVLYDEDLNLMKKIVSSAKENGINAIIATDQSVLLYAKKINIPIHASTQLSISNIESVKYFSQFVDVIVLARELSLNQISKITTAIEKEKITGPSGKLIRIEVFAHGALCMAISGKCFLSHHMDNSSANRGGCYQNCRREYSIKDDRNNELKISNQYILSPKDLNTVGFIDQILDAGVKVFKIEGRGRSADYVKTVTKVYKDAVTSVQNGSYNAKYVESLNKRLETVFNRGFWDGHFLGKNLNEWNAEIYGSKATTKKIYLGKGKKYFKKIMVGEFELQSGTLKISDKIIITGPTTGVLEMTVKELRLENESVNIVNKGDNFSMPVSSIIRNSDKLYKIIKTNR